MTPKIRRCALAASIAVSLIQPASSAFPTFKCKGKVANIVGTKGDDEIGGTQNRDVIVARGGNDAIFARDGNDLICAGRGNDVITGRGGNDRIYGEGGSDFMHGAKGKDTLIAGGGLLHFLFGDAGNDTITGNRLLALAMYETSPRGVNVNLATGTVRGQGRDTLRKIDFVTGSKHDDVIRGDARGNILYGSAGDDTLRAGGNKGSLTGLKGLGVVTSSIEVDILVGDGVYDFSDLRKPGNDTLIGGPGLNAASYLSSTDPVQADLNKGEAVGQGNDNLKGIQVLIGSIHDDSLLGDSSDNAFEGEAGADEINGRGGDDTVTFIDATSVLADLGKGQATPNYALSGDGDGDASTDSLKAIEDILGALGADQLTGDGGDNQIFGFEGDDTIAGAAGADSLIGGGGNDTIDGGGGIDTCDGEDTTDCESGSPSPQPRRAGAFFGPLSALPNFQPAPPNWFGYRFRPLPVGVAAVSR